MKTSRVLVLIVVAAIAAFIYFSVRSGETPEQYIRSIQDSRAERDNFMRTSSESPIAGSTDTFTGLKFFPVDPRFRIRARLVPIDNRKSVLLPTSDGKSRHYLEFAYAEFSLGEVRNRLLILEIIDPGPYQGTLFLAFTDETSARETYGAGRYLDLKRVKGATTIDLDFNQAYNPYCAYSDKFSCPFPPPENNLKVAIKAGERSYH